MQKTELGWIPQSAIEAHAAPFSPATRLRSFRRDLIASDAVSLVGALLAVHLVTFGWAPPPTPVLTTMVVGPVLWTLLFRSLGLYELTQLSRSSAWEDVRGIVSAASVGVLVLLIVGSWWDHPVTRSSLALLVVFVLSFELVTRSFVKASMLREKRQGRLSMRTLIVGANEEAHALARQLASPGGWFAPVGSIALSNGRSGALDVLPVVGHVDELETAIRRHSVDCVFVATTAVTREDVLDISRACRRAGVELRLTANVSDFHVSRLSFQSVDGMMSIGVSPAGFARTQAAIKRGVDLLLAPIFLLLAFPSLVVLAVAIKVTSPGPVLFRQERVTKNGRRFTMYKLRTMETDSRPTLDGPLIDLTRPFFKMENDPRLTRVGRFLRTSSLDELPQLWNVIRGDMSLVGPRPLPSDQVAANDAFLSPRHEVRGGLTGLWQVSGRSELDSAEALRMDRFYIDNWSLALDFAILVKTASTVLSGRGAY